MELPRGHVTPLIKHVQTNAKGMKMWVSFTVLVAPTARFMRVAITIWHPAAASIQAQWPTSRYSQSVDQWYGVTKLTCRVLYITIETYREFIQHFIRFKYRLYYSLYFSCRIYRNCLQPRTQSNSRNRELAVANNPKDIRYKCKINVNGLTWKNPIGSKFNAIIIYFAQTNGDWKCLYPDVNH